MRPVDGGGLGMRRLRGTESPKRRRTLGNPTAAKRRGRNHRPPNDWDEDPRRDRSPPLHHLECHIPHPPSGHPGDHTGPHPGRPPSPPFPSPLRQRPARGGVPRSADPRCCSRRAHSNRVGGPLHRPVPPPPPAETGSECQARPLRGGLPLAECSAGGRSRRLGITPDPIGLRSGSRARRAASRPRLRGAALHLAAIGARPSGVAKTIRARLRARS
jgi:hypothetical protein